jgi:hypothetical protein
MDFRKTNPKNQITIAQRVVTYLYHFLILQRTVAKFCPILIPRGAVAKLMDFLTRNQIVSQLKLAIANLLKSKPQFLNSFVSLI